MWGLPVVVLAVSAWVFSTAWPQLRAELPTLGERQLVQQWSSGASKPRERSHWTEVASALLESAAIQPRDPLLHELIGNMYRVASVQDWAVDSERTAWLALAEKHYRLSLDLRASDPLVWALLANTLEESGKLGPPMHQAAERAIQLGPNESHVQQLMLTLVLRHWTAWPDSVRDWVVTLYARGTASQRRAINELAGPFGVRFSSQDEAPTADAGR